MSEEIKNEEVKENATPEEALETIDEIKKAVEAILYAAGYAVTYEKLGEVLGLTEKDVRTIVDSMTPEFENRGISLLTFDKSCQLCTKEKFMPYIREALGIRRGGNLSASSLEVLAVVAYNQPVTRAFIDQVRGVDSSYAVNSLIDKSLIESAGRLDAPGRPMLYVTTDKFLRVFGFNSLDDLPATEQLVDTSAKAAEEGEVAEESAAEDTEVAEELVDDDMKIADGKIENQSREGAEIVLDEGGDSDDDETGGEVENIN